MSGVSILIMGAGQMGTGIVQSSLVSGHFVWVYDLYESSLEKCEKALNAWLEKKYPQQMEDCLKRVHYINHLRDLDLPCFDICIEAVSEDLSIKRSIFESLNQLHEVPRIVCSNTSSLSIATMATFVKKSESFLGLHFMNPVPVMPLVEVIPHEGTKPEIIKQIQDFCESLGKTPVVCQDQPGFIVNRLLIPYIHQAIQALESGLASVTDIDNAMRLGANMPMGPLQLADFIGLDTCLAILKTLQVGFKNDVYAPCCLLKKMVEEGKLGKKSGKGFFTYTI